MKFNTTFEKVMNESLLEGQADYGDVMDALKKLQTVIQVFEHSYPMSRGSHIHAAYKAEIERMAGRIREWNEKQALFVKQKQSGINPDTDAPVSPTVKDSITVR